MRMPIAMPFGRVASPRATVVASILLAAAMLGCTGGDGETEQRLGELEAKVESLEESLAAAEDENAKLRDEISALREQDGAAAGEEQVGVGERLEDIERRLAQIEVLAALVQEAISRAQAPSDDEDDTRPSIGGSAEERTARLVEDTGGEVHYIDHPDRDDRAVLVTPRAFVAGETPLIVSLHGYGGDAAYQAAYVPLHEYVDARGFALLLPSGSRDAEGTRFWNPTDHCCEGGKTGEDDVAHLTDLVEMAREVRDFGAVHFFGYSNGGFMSYHMACKGLPGLRAVASLAGTSYVEDSSCAGAPPVSVLHIHGTADETVLFDGDEHEVTDGETAFYIGAREMVTRWARRAGCEWPTEPAPVAELDLDGYVPGAETQVYRLTSGCAEGVTIELWTGVGSSHGPDYGEAFVEALLDWLLSQD
ncbi:MAG: hypothetical protein F4X26_04855 [Chloroflexi bacterium]|nr:hypothetical protein [Chloroflexota bacterium]